MATKEEIRDEVVNRSRRSWYVFFVTFVLLCMALAFGLYMPDALIAKIIVEKSFEVISIIVVAYLASSSVDYTGVLSKVPGLRVSQAQPKYYDNTIYQEAPEPPVQMASNTQNKEQNHVGPIG